MFFQVIVVSAAFLIYCVVDKESGSCELHAFWQRPKRNLSFLLMNGVIKFAYKAIKKAENEIPMGKGLV